MKNPTKTLSKIRSDITKEIEGGVLEPLSGNRLICISDELRIAAMHVFANEIKFSLPSSAKSIKWNGWYGENEMGLGTHGRYVDEVELIFMIGGMAYELPVYKDFYDYDSAPLTLISYLADMPVSNIDDAEAAILKINQEEDAIMGIGPDAIEEFCALAFTTSDVEEWSLK